MDPRIPCQLAWTFSQYRMADQQSFMMVHNVDCERPLEGQAPMPRASSNCLLTRALLASHDRASLLAPQAHSNESRSRSFLFRVFPHGRDCSQPRWCDNEKETRAVIHGQISSWEPEMPPTSPHACLCGLTFSRAITHWPLACCFLWMFVMQTLSNSPLQKRERTGKLRVWLFSVCLKN